MQKKEEGRRNPWEGIYPDTPTEAMQADICKNEVCKKGGREEEPLGRDISRHPPEAMQADIYYKNDVCKKRREGGGTPGKGYIPTPPTEARQADIYKNEVSVQKRRNGGGTPGKGYIPTPPLKPGRQASIRMKSAKKEGREEEPLGRDISRH
jgi:hypothetical protein